MSNLKVKYLFTVEIQYYNGTIEKTMYEANSVVELANRFKSHNCKWVILNQYKIGDNEDLYLVLEDAEPIIVEKEETHFVLSRVTETINAN